MKIYKQVPVDKSHLDNEQICIGYQDEKLVGWLSEENGFYTCEADGEVLEEVHSVLVETSVLDIIQKRLPSEEEIRKAAADFGKRVDPDNITLEKQADCLFGHKTGSEWLRDKILKEAE